ncbi:hypothetical protein N7G274_005654 [Stereocaulon virgatum]|uniref:Uncharacterized protein n=1 Tax=Stereocaulon virgatum TaxID=373712 RepID=A0ABR4AAX4_9LECA
MLSEWRRRLFCHVFANDKKLLTLTGRRPALSRRYSTCRMTLDLGDAQMVVEGQELEQLKDALDYDGWNISGEVHPNTSCRAWFEMSSFRDKILELSLGPSIEAYDTETRRE